MTKKVTHYKELENKLEALGHNEVTVQAIVSAMASVDKYDLSNDEKHVVYSLLSSVGMEALEELPEAVAKGEWVPFDYGNVFKGDYVRVRKDAYTAESAVNHNGKVGRLANAYAGRFTLSYIGLDTGQGFPHPMDKLESLKKV